MAGDEKAKETLAKRQANAAVALLRLGQTAGVWPLLKHSPDPRVRSYLIHRLSPLGVDPQSVTGRLDEEQDVSIRRALILCLGEFDEQQLPLPERQPLIAKLLDSYRGDPDPGIHGAADWLLRRWRQEEKLAQIDEKLKENVPQRRARQAKSLRDWFINSQGQTFAMYGPLEFLQGSPDTESDRGADEVQHRVRLSYRFAISAKEVTVAQFESFRKENPDVRRVNIKRNAPEPDCPQVAADWYDAARYCNWLSAKDGLPPEQWCYVSDKKAQGRLKPAKDFLQRRGYRLPTESEWESACRSGTVTARYYGETDELLDHYV